MKGLEPILLTEPDPKSGAATNYATSAKIFEGAKLQKILILHIYNKKYYFFLFLNAIMFFCIFANFMENFFVI